MRATVLTGVLLTVQMAAADGLPRPDIFNLHAPLAGCYNLSAHGSDRDPLFERMLKYSQLAVKHRVSGLASYYSTFFDGRKTANGETYRNQKYSAAHLTLPLGTMIEVTSRATGRKLRIPVNDRGPFVEKFCLDLSQSAARYLGVDVARDRHVDIHIVALPGEDPLPDGIDFSAIDSIVAGSD